MATKTVMLQQPALMPHGAGGPRYSRQRGTSGVTRCTRSGDARAAATHGGKATVKKVAIVDDEDDLVAVYAIMVRRWGHHVEFTGSNGTDIVKAFDGKKSSPTSSSSTIA